MYFLGFIKTSCSLLIVPCPSCFFCGLQFDGASYLFLYALRSFPAPVPPVSAVTPLLVEQFAWELQLHPQQLQVEFVLDGIRHGFKLGFCPSQKLKSAKRNKPSATQHASVIDAYLENEVSLGRVVCPFDSPSLVTSKLVALVSFRKKANQENGISLWTCLPQGGLMSMMGLTQMSLLFITLLLFQLFA